MFSNDQFLKAYAVASGNSLTAKGELDDKTREEAQLGVMGSHTLEVADYMQVLFDDANAAGSLPFPATILHSATTLSRAVLTQRSAQGPSAWFHLIYAYMLENTRIYELMERVPQVLRHGETLGIAGAATQQWLQATEALFYRQQSAHDHTSMTTLTSDARDDGRAIRRNAYFRMFGMDLNHGTADNKPYPYIKPELSNRDFVETLEMLLRELWIAWINQNTNESNPTDVGAIESMTRRLSNMLNNRRINGTLTSEEFSAVATLDWLRLAVSFNSPVVIDLKAEAASEAERLQKIAERVALPVHGKADDYFNLAAPMSFLLRGIEVQAFTTVDSYMATPDTQRMLTDIITYWSNASGKVLKQRAKPSVVSAVA